MGREENGHEAEGAFTLRIRDVLAYSLAVLLVGLAGLFIFRTFPHLPFVRELTTSGSVLRDDNKVRDVALPFLLLLVQALACLALVAVASSQKLQFLGRPIPIGASGGAAAILLSAGAFTCAAWLLNNIAGALAFLLVLGAAGVLRRISGEGWRLPFSGAAILAALVAIGLGRFGFTDFQSILGITFTAAVLALVALRPHERVLRLGYGAIALAISFAGLTLAPFIWLPGARPSLLDALVAVPSVVAGWMTIQWLRHPARNPPLLPLAVAFALAATPRPFFGYVPPDDYHFGELLLASRALVEGGLFTRELTPHGLSDAMGALGAGLLNMPDLAGIQIGQTLGSYLVAALCASLLFAFTGPLVGLLILLASNPMTHWLPLAAFLLVIAASRLRPAALYGCASVLASAVSVFTLGGMGFAIAASAVLMSILLFRHWTRASAIAATGGAAVGLLPLLAILPAVAGEFFFLKVSSATNLFVYGTNFVPFPQSAAAYLALGVAMLFIGAPLLGLGLIWNGQLPAHIRPRLLITRIIPALVPLAAFTALVAPYAMGRLDSIAPRATMATLLTLSVLVVWLQAPRLQDRFGPLSRRRVVSSQFVLAALALLCGSTTFSLPRYWASFGAFPPQVSLLDGETDRDLPGLGTARVKVEREAFLKEIAATMNRLLKPGETYLDLTNRNALYFYLGRPAPMPVASVYNAAPNAFQVHDLAALEANPPPVALISAATLDHDGLSLPLRSFRIYDWVMRTYRPVRIGSFIYGIRQDLPAPPEAAATPEAELALWMAAFHRSDIQRLPAAWGRSLPQLASQLSGRERPLDLRLVAGAQPEGGRFIAEGPAATFDIPLPPDVDTAHEGLLKLSLACMDAGEAPYLRILWATEGEALSVEQGLTLNASYRDLLVPLDASPRWLKSPPPRALRLLLEAAPGCREFTLSGAALTGRQD